MPYSTQTDLEKHISLADLVQFTDDDNDGNPDTGIISEAISGGDGVIDSYINARYTLPLATVPDVVKGISIDLALYNIRRRRPGKIEELFETRYKNAMGFLKDIGKGTASLGIDPEPSGGSQQVKTGRKASDRTFTIGKSGAVGSLDNY